MQDTGTDNRRFGFFMIDNELIDNYELSPHTGWLYVCIARHINQQSGVAFPSLKTLAKKAGMSKSSVVKHLNILKENKLITIHHIKNDNGGNSSNHYILCDIKGGVVQEMDKGSAGNGHGVVQEVDTNNTKYNNTKLHSFAQSASEETESIHHILKTAGGETIVVPSTDSSHDVMETPEHVCYIGKSLCEKSNTDLCTPECKQKMGIAQTVANQDAAQAEAVEEIPTPHDWFDYRHMSILQTCSDKKSYTPTSVISGDYKRVEKLKSAGYLICNPKRMNSVVITEAGKQLLQSPMAHELTERIQQAQTESQKRKTARAKRAKSGKPTKTDNRFHHVDSRAFTEAIVAAFGESVTKIDDPLGRKTKLVQDAVTVANDLAKGGASVSEIPIIYDYVKRLSERQNWTEPYTPHALTRYRDAALATQEKRTAYDLVDTFNSELPVEETLPAEMPEF